MDQSPDLTLEEELENLAKALADLTDMARAGTGEDISDVVDTAVACVPCTHMFASRLPAAPDSEALAVLEPIIAHGKAAMEGVAQYRALIRDDTNEVRLGTPVRAIGFWISALARAWWNDADSSDVLLAEALSWPSVYPPVTSILYGIILADRVLDIPIQDQALRHTVARYLGAPPFVSDSSSLLNQAHRSKDASAYGGAATLFRAAASNSPGQLDGLLGEVWSLQRAAVNLYTSQHLEVGEIQPRLDLLAGQLLNSAFIEPWRMESEPRWRAAWEQGATRYEVSRTEVLDPSNSFSTSAVSSETEHRPPVQPLSLVVEGLLRICNLDELQQDYDGSGDPYVVFPVRRADLPRGWYKDWALEQIQTIVQGGRSESMQVLQRFDDVDDGLKATYRRLELGFDLAAKEVTVLGQTMSLNEAYAQAREAALAVLRDRLGGVWTEMPEPTREQLLETEVQFQFQGDAQLGGPNLIAMGLVGVLESWLKDWFRRASRTPVLGTSTRFSLSSIATSLRQCRRHDNAFDAGGVLGTLWRCTQRYPEFWWEEIPALVLDAGVGAWRDPLVHEAAAPPWSSIVTFRDQLLGSPTKPGVLQRTPPDH